MPTKLAPGEGLEPPGDFRRPVNSRVQYHSAHPGIVSRGVTNYIRNRNLPT